jgi:hypothetical protein
VIAVDGKGVTDMTTAILNVACLNDIKTDKRGEPFVFVATYLGELYGDLDFQLFTTYEAATEWLKGHGHEPGDLDRGDKAEINRCEVRLS